jgi:hypothetical protein
MSKIEQWPDYELTPIWDEVINNKHKEALFMLLPDDTPEAEHLTPTHRGKPDLLSDLDDLLLD